MALGTLNIVAAVVFAVALCWRIDRIRREAADLQSIAITVAIAALTVGFVLSNKNIAAVVDSALFQGAARLGFYCLLAVGVAALIVVFFFGSEPAERQRRAGMEAAPLVISMIGLHVTMLVTPIHVRNEHISLTSARYIGFALFFIIAGGYLTYGFISCVKSVGRYSRMAIGPLRVALTLNMCGLISLAIGTLLQTIFVVGSFLHVWDLPVLLNAASVLAVIGVGGFLIGVSFPMVWSGWVRLRDKSRHRHDIAVLEPLWALVTSALPELVLPTEDDAAMSTSLLFRRRVIEIRDALSQVSPLLGDDFNSRTPSMQATELHRVVCQVADAGIPSGQVKTILPPEGEGLNGDARPLLRLAAAMRSARQDDQPSARQDDQENVAKDLTGQVG